MKNVILMSALFANSIYILSANDMSNLSESSDSESYSGSYSEERSPSNEMDQYFDGALAPNENQEI